MLIELGCATTGTYQNASAGFVGCPPDQIKISDTSSGFGASSWVAECKGKKYYCSAVGQGGGTNCKASE